MPRTIKVAAAQMDANPAPITERLDRAERIVIQAAQANAQLVILPELFNTGYAYTDANYRLAEPMGGTTSRWMKGAAARLDIYLAGSLMLWERGEIYNALLLFSPTGQMWRYDKNYPWAWERGYFRGRRGVTVAHTELGDLGMMVCWDIGHLNLWRQYAGQVDMMIIASCPPDGPNATYHFPDGSHVNLNDLGPLMASTKDSGKRVFSDMVSQQAAWLGVPVANTGASGHIRTSVPRGDALVRCFSLFAPRLLKQLPQARQLQMSCNMISSCKMVNASGQVLAERTQAESEGFTMAEVTLPKAKLAPRELQPEAPFSRAAYLHADVLIPFLMRPVYRKGLQQILACFPHPLPPSLGDPREAEQLKATDGSCAASVAAGERKVRNPG